MAAPPAILAHAPRNATARAAPAPHRDWDRALLVGAYAAHLAAGIAFAGIGFFATPDVGFVIPGLLGALLIAATPRAWAIGLGTALMSLMPLVVLLGFGAAGELGQPLLGGSWVSAMLLTLALVLVVPTGVARVRRARAGLGPAEPGTRFGVTLLAATALLGATAAGGLAASQALDGGAGAAYDFAPAATVTVVSEGFAFPEAPVAVPRGEVVEVVVENRDPAAHTFTYAVGDATYDHFVPGNGEVRFLARIDEAGDLQYWCKPHSSGAPGAKTGMVGTLAVA